MRINNFYGASKSQQPSTQKKPAFKGYFACPIKELHVHPRNDSSRANRVPIIQELQARCGRFFRILVQTANGVVDARDFKASMQDASGDFHQYGQDNKVFRENMMLLLTGCQKKAWLQANELAEHLKIPTREINGALEGGNCFLGKKPNGDDFILVGNDSLVDSTSKRVISKKDIAKELGLSLNNVHVIPQLGYHADIAIRPLKYPYVLVDNRNLTHELTKAERQIKSVHGEHDQYLFRHGYSTPYETAHELEQQGFKPIFVPGSLGDNRTAANYMNAIVHEKPDGSLVYITNHSRVGHYFDGVNMEEIFSQHLKEKCPEVSEVIFIDGKEQIERCLGQESAGIHCLFSENPNFRDWVVT